MLPSLSKYGKYETTTKFKQPSAKCQVPSAKSQRLRLMSPFKYSFYGILITLCKKISRLVLQVGSHVAPRTTKLSYLDYFGTSYYEGDIFYVY
jgi:hypothetical protein